MDPLTSPPASFPAKTTVKVTRTWPDYPANGGWTLTAFLASGAVVLAASSVAPNAIDPAAYDITYTDESTAALAAGRYQWVERVTSADPGTPIYDPLEGAAVYVEVTPNLTTAVPGTYLSWEEKELVLVRQAIEARTALLATLPDRYGVGTRNAERDDKVLESLRDRADWLQRRIDAKAADAGPLLTRIPINYERLGGH